MTDPAMRRIEGLVLLADDTLALVSVGKRGGHKIEWRFGKLMNQEKNSVQGGGRCGSSEGAERGPNGSGNAKEPCSALVRRSQSWVFGAWKLPKALAFQDLAGRSVRGT